MHSDVFIISERIDRQKLMPLKDNIYKQIGEDKPENIVPILDQN